MKNLLSLVTCIIMMMPFSVAAQFSATNYSDLTLDKTDYAPGELYLKLKNSVPITWEGGTSISLSSIPELVNLQKKYSITAVEAPFHFTESPELKRTFLVHFKKHSKTDKLISELESFYNVDYCERKPLDAVYSVNSFRSSDPWPICKDVSALLMSSRDNIQNVDNEISWDESVSIEDMEFEWPVFKATQENYEIYTTTEAPVQNHVYSGLLNSFSEDPSIDNSSIETYSSKFSKILSSTFFLIVGILFSVLLLRLLYNSLRKVCSLSIMMAFMFACSWINSSGQTSISESKYSSNEVFVKLESYVPIYWSNYDIIEPSTITQFKGLVGKYQIQEVRNSFRGSADEKLIRTFRIQIFSSTKLNDFIADLKNTPGIEYAEKVSLNKVEDSPNDPGNQWAMDAIFAHQGHDLIPSSLGNFKLGLVDDAFQTSNADLSFLAGYDVADLDTDVTPPSSSYPHGTMVASAANAIENNNILISSVGKGLLQVIPIKASNNPGFVNYGYEGITKAVNMGSKVINCSWGSFNGSYSQTSQNVIDYAWNNGCIVVCAAGNNNADLNFNTHFPSDYSNAITVGGSKQFNNNRYVNLPYGSNYGNSVDIVGPSQSVRVCNLNGTTSVVDGTSFGSPIVAATICLMWNCAPQKTRADILNCLYSSAQPLTWAGSGSGLVNVQAGLQCVLGSSSSVPANDICGSATLIQSYTSCNFTSGTVDGATPDISYGIPSCDNYPNPLRAGVWHKFMGISNSHVITVDPSGTLDAVVVLYSGTNCNNLVEVDCEDSPGGNGGLTVLNANNLVIGNTYWILVYDYGGAPPISGGFDLCVTHQGTPPPAPCLGTSQYPSQILSPTNVFQVQNGVNAGNYMTMNVVMGQTYEISICTVDGGSASYDTEIFVTDNSNNPIVDNDDFCGLQSKVTWTSTFTGVVRIHLLEYHCITNNISTSIAYKKVGGSNSGASAVCVGIVEIDDDNSGGSNGNGDSIINGGETIELDFAMQNIGTIPLTGVKSTVSTNSPLVAYIHDDDVSHGTVAPSAIDIGVDWDIEFVNNLPPNSIVPLTVTITSDQGTWTCIINLVVGGCLPVPPPTLSGPSLSCVGNTETYTQTGLNSSVNYSWACSAGGFIASASNTSPTVQFTWINSGSQTVYCIFQNCIGLDTVSYYVTVNNAASGPTLISGSTAPCMGVQTTYSVGGFVGTPNWTLTGNASFVGPTNSNSVTVVANGTATLSFSTTGNCGSTPAITKSINPTGLPNAPSPINGNATVCQNSNQTYSINGIAGTALWSSTGGIAIQGSNIGNSVQVIVSGAGGSIYVVDSTNCGSSPQTSLTISTTQAPTNLTINGTNSACQNGTEVYNIGTIPSGYNASWSVTGATIAGATNGAQVNVQAGTSNYSVSVVLTGCTTLTANKSVNIAAVPTAPTAISGNFIPCVNSLSTYSTTVQNGSTANWTVTGGNIIGSAVGQNVDIIFTSSNGTISVVATSTTCNLSSSTTSANVSTSNAPSMPTLIGSINPCYGQVENYTFNVVGTPVVNVIGGQVVNLTSSSLSVLWTGTTGIITLADSSASCGVSPVFVLNNINIGSPPAVSLTSFPMVATNQTITLASGIPTGGTYFGSAGIIGTNQFDASLVGPGTHIIGYRLSNNCGADTAWGTIQVVFPTGIEDVEKSAFIIYPNPVDGLLNINGQELEGVDYKIYNGIFQVVLKGTIISQQIDVTNIASGLYYLKIDGHNDILKFQKQ